MQTPSDRVRSIFEEAVIREGPEGQAYLLQACTHDPEVRRQVEQMLAAVGVGPFEVNVDEWTS